MKLLVVVLRDRDLDCFIEFFMLSNITGRRDYWRDWM